MDSRKNHEMNKPEEKWASIINDLVNVFVNKAAEDITDKVIENIANRTVKNSLSANLGVSQQEPGKQVLNSEETRERYGFSKSHLYNLTSKRLIPHSRRGKYLAFSVEKVDNWLLENQIPTQDEISLKADEYLNGKEVLNAK